MTKKKGTIHWVFWVGIAIFAVAAALMFVLDRSQPLDYCGRYILTMPDSIDTDYDLPSSENSEAVNGVSFSENVKFASVNVSENANEFVLDWWIEAYSGQLFKCYSGTDHVAKSDVVHHVMKSNLDDTILVDQGVEATGSDVKEYTETKILFYQNGLTISLGFSESWYGQLIDGNWNGDYALPGDALDIIYMYRSDIHLQKTNYEILSVYQLVGLASLVLAVALLLTVLIKMILLRGKPGLRDIILHFLLSLLCAGTLVSQLLGYGYAGFYSNGAIAFRIMEDVKEDSYFVEYYDIHLLRQQPDAASYREISSWTNYTNYVTNNSKGRGTLVDGGAELTLTLKSSIYSGQTPDILQLTKNGIYYVEKNNKLTGSTYSTPLTYSLTRISDSYELRRVANVVVPALVAFALISFVGMLLKRGIYQKKSLLKERLQRSFRVGALQYVTPQYEAVMEYMFAHMEGCLFDADVDHYTLNDDTVFPITYKGWDRMDIKELNREIDSQNLKLKKGFALCDEDGTVKHGVCLSAKREYLVLYMDEQLLAVYELVRNVIHENPDEAELRAPYLQEKEVSDDEWKMD